MADIIDFDQFHFNAASSSSGDCSSAASDQPQAVQLTVTLEPEITDFLDILRQNTEHSREYVAECLLLNSFCRYMLACKLDALELPDDTEIPGINAFIPITPADLVLACKYLDLLVNPEEVLPDGE